jgi:glycosidase
VVHQRSVLRGSLPSALTALLLACGGSGGSAAPLPPNTEGWWRDHTFYEVFVRSFADSTGDGVGDLPGLTARLDYLNDGDPGTTTDLGVDAIWLMPIFPSPSYHGYDVMDYRGVHPQYGTLADLDALVAAAHARGIRVILDMVPNHSSRLHAWFLDARSSPAAARRDWYVWSATQPAGWPGSPWRLNSTDGTWYYAYFDAGMPDLNYRNAAVEAELVASMKFWLARGVDGFRLDAVRHLVENGPQASLDQPESHALLRRMRAALQAEYPGALLVGEAWASVETVAAYHGDGDELQLAFSFELADAVKQAAVAGDASGVINVIARTEAALAGKDRGFEAPFLSNHDQDRVMRAVGGDASAARLAAATLLALPGTPFLYYGEEIGMQGGTSDPDRRTPLRWTSTAPEYGFTTGTPWRSYPEAAGVDVASQQADPGSLWNLYRRLLALRRAAPGLTSVEAVRPATAGAGPGVLALVRGGAGARVLLVANYATAASGPFEVAVAGTPAVLEAEGLAGAPSASAGALAFPGLAARGFALVALD